MTRDEKNRIIAEGVMRWYKPTNDETSECLAKKWYELRHWTLHRHSGAPIENFSSYYWTPPDFYASEEASAMLLEKMPWPILQLAPDKESWMCHPGHGSQEMGTWHRDKDRKTAIAEAALKLAAESES